MRVPGFLTFFLFSLSSFAQDFSQLRNSAGLAAETGDFEKAITLSQKAIELAKTDKPATEDLLSLRSENASYYLLSEKLDEGLALFEALQKELAGGNYPVAEMNVCHNFGLGLLALGFYGDALPLLQKAKDLGYANKMEAKDLVSCIGGLAVCYQYQYDFRKSEELFKEAEAICVKGSLSQSSDYAYLQSSFALLYRDMQLPMQASTCYQKAEKVYAKARDTLNPQYPVFLTDYGSMLAESSLFDKALSLTFRAKNLDKKLYTENSSAYAAELNNLGFIYSKMNRIVETEQFYTQSLKIKKSLPFQRLDNYLSTVSNLMVFYANVGRDEEARALARELEEGLENKILVDTLKRATFANNLAVEFKAWGDTEKAMRYFRDALRYYEAIYGRDNTFSAEIYMDMGNVLFITGDYKQTATYLNKAAEVYSKTGIGSDVNSISTLCNLAVILKQVERSKEADAYMDQAMEIAKKSNVTQADLLEQIYINKAEIAADLDDVKTSTDYFNKYLELKYSQIEQNFSYMTENEKMFYLEEFEHNIKNFYALILSRMDKYPELIKALLDFRLKTKSMLLNNLSKIRESIIEQNDPVLNAKFEDLKLKRETVAKLMSFNTQEYPYALAEATAMKAEADLLEKEISLKVSGSFSGNVRAISWKTIQKLLSPGEAAVEIFQSYLHYYKGQGKGTNYTFLVIRPSGDPIAISIDRLATWEDEVLNLYRNSIEFRKDEPDLYRRLWKFVDEKLGDAKTVYVSPDGIYNQVNIQTIYNEEKKSYLADGAEIHLLNTLNDLLRIKSSPSRKPAKVVLVGNPKFDFDITKLNAGKKEKEASVELASRGAFGFVLSELPGTKEEVEVVKTLLDKNGVGSSLMMEEAANEKAVKQIKDPDVLHMATHGFFLEDPKDEDLAGYDKMEKEFYRNPMLRSGVFFSGANKDYAINTDNVSQIDDFEDGMLTSYEAMNLSLNRTELVVLSACQTGLGKVKNGEGVYGLQRAFKLAGAKSVIMSLWPVSDEATKDLMISFYQGWISSGNLYQAFRQAQAEVKKKYPQPYYWGAFVLVGR